MTTINPSKLRAASATGADWLPIPASCGLIERHPERDEWVRFKA